MKKFLVISSAIVLSVFAFFFSNIKGYYRFKQYCEAEGGLRVYEPLERNVGWSAKNYGEAKSASLLKHVEFVRYTDEKDGEVYDIRYLGGDPQDETSFERLPADQSKTPVYGWNFINYENIKDEIRLALFGYEVYSINGKKVTVRYSMFEFLVFENALLGGASSKECFHEVGRGNEPSRWRNEINSSFKN